MSDQFAIQVTPTVAVVVDESLCIMLRTRLATPLSHVLDVNEHTISNIDALTDALREARQFVATREGRPV